MLVAQLGLTLCNPIDCSPPGSTVHEIFPARIKGVCCHFLLQGIFPIKGLTPGLLHCRQILYRLSYKGRSDSYLFLIIFPGGTSVKEHACMPANAEDSRDASLIPESGRSPGGGHGNPLQYFCLEKKVPTEEPGRLQSIGSQRVRRD